MSSHNKQNIKTWNHGIEINPKLKYAHNHQRGINNNN